MICDKNSQGDSLRGRCFANNLDSRTLDTSLRLSNDE